MNLPIPARGVYAALLTPRRPDFLDADTATFLEYLDKVCSAGVDGLVFFGSTGEFVHYDLEQRMHVVTMGLRRSRLPVLVNVSHSTLAGACDLAEHAIDAGASGVLLMPPYFYRYGDDEIAQFYEAFLKLFGGKTQIYLYNLPFFTNPIPSPLMNRLLGVPAFAGIKDSSGEWEQFEALRRLRETTRFHLLIGHERIYVKGLQAGADGIVSGVAAAVPELPVAIDRAVRASGVESAHALSSRLDEFLAWLDKFPSTVTIKQAADVRGWLRSELAAPLGETASRELVAFRHWFAEWLPRTLAECAESAAVRT